MNVEELKRSILEANIIFGENLFAFISKPISLLVKFDIL